MEIGQLNKQEIEDHIKQLETEIRDIDDKQYPDGVKKRALADLQDKIRWARLSLTTRFPA